MPSLRLLCGYRAFGSLGTVINTFPSPAGNRRLWQAGSALGPAPYLLVGGRISQHFMVQGKTCQRAILPRPLCLGMRLSRVCRHHRLLREPTSHETPWLDLVYPFGVGVFTRLLFFSFDYFFPFTCIWLISLPAPGNKGTASSQPRRGISAPCPDSCIALLGTTDLCSFVRVIPPFCVNYALPAWCLSPPQSDYFRCPPS